MSLEVVSATVVEVIVFNPTLRAIRFMPDKGGIPRYAPGDYLYVRVPASGEASASSIRSLTSRPQVRAYSLSSAPSQSFYETVVVQKEGDPHVSLLLQHIETGGEKLEISDPSWVRHGKLSLNGNGWEQEKYLMISGGTGIVPFVSAVRSIAALGSGTDVWLLGSFRGPEHLIFHEELVEIARKHPNIKYYPTLTREMPSDWRWGKGRFTAGKFSDIVPDLAERTVFLCAGCKMINDIKQTLIAAGMDVKNRIKTECWG